MRKILFALLASSLLGISSGSAQAPAINQRDLESLIQEVRSQQARLVANQDKIDAKLAEIVEAVRVARIFAGRGGK